MPSNRPTPALAAHASHRHLLLGLAVALALPQLARADAAPASASVAAAPMTAPIPTPTSAPAPAALERTVAALDQRLFAAYDAHDVTALMAQFEPGLEFFHDTGGLLGWAQVRDGFAGIFARNPDIRRTLVPGSLRVFPVPGYGAIQLGAHRFCHTERGKLDCGTFQFMHVWHEVAGDWRVTRVVSWDHR